jgi:hypothetical protein
LAIEFGLANMRKNPPKTVSQAELDRAIESLEAPWGVRIERVIREAFDAKIDDPMAASTVLLEKVWELGLQPFIQPQPLPVIDKDDITLVCWMWPLIVKVNIFIH